MLPAVVRGIIHQSVIFAIWLTFC